MPFFLPVRSTKTQSFMSPMFRTIPFFVFAATVPLSAQDIVPPLYQEEKLRGVLELPVQEQRKLPEALSSYHLDPAPAPRGLLLQKGDRLAICGDSITEQKLYSLAIETYLTACMPHLNVTCRQYGWSGEQAGGFLSRMKNDVLRFEPTIATTCYGMNDFRYVPYEEAIGAEYRKNMTAIVDAFTASGARIVIGSPGIIDSVPHWVEAAKGFTQPQLNQSLSKFRNLGVSLAAEKQTGFADVYQEMLIADYEAKQKFGDKFKVAGEDGVHPAWAGQIVMAYAFLQGLGLDGDLGTISYDEATKSASASGGHQATLTAEGEISISSQRLPFAPGTGSLDKDDSIRAGMDLVGFDDHLNRLTFRIAAPASDSYEIQWGSEKKTFTADQLRQGINLAKEFQDNPLVPAFRKIEEAVLAKQTYETRQIKELVHGPEGAADVEATFTLTEKARAPLEAAVKTALEPVTHKLLVSAR